MPEQPNPSQWAQERARRIAGSMLERQAAGEPLSEYSETWDQLAPEFRRLYPDASEADAAETRDLYHTLRNEYASAGLLNRAVQENAGVDRTRYWLARTPFVGAASETAFHGYARRSAEAIRAGEATQGDYDTLGRYLANQEALSDRGALQSVLDIVTHIPAFGAELAATSGVFRAGSGLAQAGVRAAAAPAAARGWVRGGAGTVAGSAAQTAANLPRVAQAIERRRGGITAAPDEAPDGRSFWEALGPGAFDAFTETFTERLGGTRPFQAAASAAGGAAGGALARLGMGGVTEAIQQGIANRWQRLTRAVPGGNRLARATSWNGLVSEMLEERAGEVMRGAVLGDDLGATGDLAQGDLGGFLHQMLIEGLAFSLYGGGMRVVGDLRNAGSLPRAGSEEFRLAQNVLAARLLSLPGEQRAAEVEQLSPLLRYYAIDPARPEAYVPEGMRIEPIDASQPKALPALREALGYGQAAEAAFAQEKEQSQSGDAPAVALPSAAEPSAAEPSAAEPSAAEPSAAEVQAPAPAAGTPETTAVPAPAAAPVTPPEPLAVEDLRVGRWVLGALEAGETGEVEMAEAWRRLNERRVKEALGRENASRTKKGLARLTLPEFQTKQKEKVARAKIPFAEFQRVVGELEKRSLIERAELTEEEAAEAGYATGAGVYLTAAMPPEARASLESQVAELRREREARAAANKIVKKRKAARLATIIQGRGGIDPRRFAKDWNVKEDFFQAGLGYLLSPGGWAIDDLAKTLVEEGHLKVPDGYEADDYLMMRLREGAVSDLYAAEEELEAAYKAFVEEQENARRAGYSAETIDQAVRGGEAAGSRPEEPGPAPEAGGELANEEDEPARPDPGTLKPEQVSFIEQKVAELGSIEAVDQKYTTASKVGDYAKAFARWLFRPGDAYEPPGAKAGEFKQDDDFFDRAGGRRRAPDARRDEGQPTRPEVLRRRQRAEARPLPPPPADAAAVADKDLLSNHEIIATMSRAFDVPLHMDHLDRMTRGLYLVGPEAIKLDLNHFGNVSTAAHEVGHHISKKFKAVENAPFDVREFLRQFDYQQDRPNLEIAREEGFAEVVRVWWTGDELKPIPPPLRAWFEGWLAERPVIQGQFQRIKELLDRYRAMSPEQRIRVNLRDTRQAAGPILTGKEQVKGLAEAAWDRAMYEMVGEGHYLKKLQERVEKATGQAFEEGAGPYGLYLALAKQGPTYALWALEHGPVLLSTLEQIPGVGGLSSFAAAIADSADLEKATAYAYARHAVEAWSKDVNPGISLADAEATVQALHNPRYEAFAQGLTQFNNAMLDVLVDAGALSAQSAQAFKDEYESYLPLWRVRPAGSQARPMAGTRYVNVGKAIKGRSGADLQVQDPLAATVARTHMFYARAARQMVINEVLKFKNVEGLGDLILREKPDMEVTRVPLQELGPKVLNKLIESGVLDPESLPEDFEFPKDVIDIWHPEYWHRGDQPVVRVLENDQPAMYRLHPDLYSFVAGMDFYTWRGVAGVFPTVMKWFKFFTTGANPAFAIKNFFRDWQTLWHQGRYAGAAARTVGVPIELVRRLVGGAVGILGGIANLAAGGKNVAAAEREMDQLFRLVGGEYLHFNGPELREMKSQARRLIFDQRPGALLKRPWRLITRAPEFLATMTGVAETIPRFLEFKAVLEQAGYTEAKLRELKAQGKRPPPELLRKAKVAAAEVTINFQEQGAFSKKINQVWPYFSAYVRGNARFARYMTQTPKGVLALRWSVYLGLITAAYLLVADDDSWQELDDYMKYSYLSLPVGGQMTYRFPLTHGQGLFVAANWIGFLESIRKNSPRPFWDSFKQSLGELLVPGSRGPVLVTPLAEAFFNRDLARGRPLETQELQRLPAAERAYPTTAPASRLLGRLTNLSPVRIEHVLNSMTGRWYGNLMAGDVTSLTGVGGLQYRGEHSRSMRTFYEELTTVREQAAAQALRGQSDPATTQRAGVLNFAARLMAELRDPVRFEPDRDARFDVQRYLIGLARSLQGQEEIARYPNPLRAATWQDMPEPVRATVQRALAVQVEHLSDPVPMRRPGEPSAVFQERAAEFRERQGQARFLLLEVAGLDPATMRRVLVSQQRRQAQEQGRPFTVTPALSQRLGRVR